MKLIGLFCALCVLCSCVGKEPTFTSAPPLSASPNASEGFAALSSDVVAESLKPARFYTVDIIENSTWLLVKREMVESGDIIYCLYDTTTEESIALPFTGALKRAFAIEKKITFITENGIEQYRESDDVQSIPLDTSLLFDYNVDGQTETLVYVDENTSDLIYQTKQRTQVIWPAKMDASKQIVARGAWPLFSANGSQLMFFELFSEAYCVRPVLYDVQSDISTPYSKPLIAPGLISGWVGDCYYVARYFSESETDQTVFNSYLVWDGHAFAEYKTLYEYTEAFFGGSHALFVDIDGNLHVRARDNQIDQIVFQASQEGDVLDAAARNDDIVVIDRNGRLQIVNNPLK